MEILKELLPTIGFNCLLFVLQKHVDLHIYELCLIAVGAALVFGAIKR